jgi:tetratricopeptide repeat protein
LFHRGAVQALAPDEPHVTPRLAVLTRKELIRPDRAQLPGDDGFRFRHILIRDAAYEALPKLTRAELHQRFAEWLEQRGADLVEIDEILGYHLEQAHRYRVELGQVEDLEALATDAATLLRSAGQRALGRGDAGAAIKLLERAAELLGRADPARTEVRTELGFALLDRGELKAAESTLGDVVEAARESGNEVVEWRARVGLTAVGLWLNTRDIVESGEFVGRRSRCSSNTGTTSALLMRGSSPGSPISGRGMRVGPRRRSPGASPVPGARAVDATRHRS